MFGAVLMQIMPTQSAQDFKYTLLCGLSSFIATFASNIVHPLEIIKTRFQSHDGSHNEKNIVPKYGGIYSAMKTIASSEGVFGLFKGFYVSFLSQSAALALFFTIYENRLMYYQDRQTEHMSSVGRASFEASILATLITQPLWIIRTRMLLNTDKINEKDNFKHNASKLYQEYGLKGYFRGAMLSLLLSMNGFIQMYVYEGCKLIFQNVKHQDTETYGSYILNVRAFISGGTAKLMSSFVMYPLTTIRTRYQQNQFLLDTTKPKYSGIIDIISRILSQEGFMGFYKGFYVNLVKGFLQRGIYFYFYQLTKKILGVESNPHKKKE